MPPSSIFCLYDSIRINSLQGQHFPSNHRYPANIQPMQASKSRARQNRSGGEPIPVPRKKATASLLAAALSLANIPLHAQIATDLTGRITDPTHTAVPGARIT